MARYEHRIILDKENYIMKDLHFKNGDIITKDLFYKDVLNSNYKIYVAEYTKDYGNIKEHLTVFTQDLAIRKI